MRGLTLAERAMLIECDGAFVPHPNFDDDNTYNTAEEAMLDMQESLGRLRPVVVWIEHDDGYEYEHVGSETTELGRLALSLWPINRVE